MNKVTSCAFFFLGPGLVYGSLTARLPALKQQIAADEAQIGVILFCIGFAGLFGLLLGPRLLSYVQCRVLILLGTLCHLSSLVISGLVTTVCHLGIICLSLGFGIGLSDVAMNTPGLRIEQRTGRHCMSLMHACYSLGGVLGSLAGALFSHYQQSAFVNFSSIAVAFALCLPIFYASLPQDSLPKKEKNKEERQYIPFFVWFCGAMAFLSFAAEGSVAEWGSLLLHTAKGADEGLAALVFGAFSIPMVCCRFLGEWLRELFGDFLLIFWGALLACAGFATIILASSPIICLISYSMIGIGLSPLVPMLFSRAGACQGVRPRTVGSVVSFLGYSGALFFPPVLGFLASSVGLEKALYAVLGLSLCIVLGTLRLRKA